MLFVAGPCSSCQSVRATRDFVESLGKAERPQIDIGVVVNSRAEVNLTILQDGRMPGQCSIAQFRKLQSRREAEQSFLDCCRSPGELNEWWLDGVEAE